MRNVCMPERTVRTVTSNSGNVVARSRGVGNDARLARPDSPTRHCWHLRHLAANAGCADGSLFLLREQVRPAGLAIAQLAREPVRAVDQDPEWARMVALRARHDLHHNGRLVE